MKQLLPFLALLALALPLRAEEAPAPLTAAVLDFQSTGDELAAKGAEVAVLLNAQLSASPDLLLVERQELEKLLGEQEIGLSGTVDAATAAKVGAITGAKVLVTGRVFGSGGKYYLVAKIIGTETSRVFGEVATFSDLAAMDKAVEQLAPKIAEVIGKRADVLVAKREDPDAQIERLKMIVAGARLPNSVSVLIEEQHLNRAVIDPTAQTEIATMLQRLGFTLFDPTGVASMPEVRIGGEAFSEFAMRRGNLVSCRARIEIKVTNSDGKVLLVDRETGVAVDLAENIAAKKALENAARKLMDRIVPKLVGK